MLIRRGDIFYADLRPVVGSEQGGVRPVLIIQNDVGNRHSPTVICASNHFTDEQGKTSNPCGVRLHQVCTGEGFRCFTGTVAHNRQDAAER